MNFMKFCVQELTEFFSKSKQESKFSVLRNKLQEISTAKIINKNSNIGKIKARY